MTISVLGKTRETKIQSSSQLWKIDHFYMLKKNECRDHVHELGQKSIRTKA